MRVLDLFCGFLFPLLETGVGAIVGRVCLRMNKQEPAKYPSFRCRVLKRHSFKPINTHTLKDDYAEIVFEVLKCHRCGSLNLSQWISIVDFKKLSELEKGVA